MEDLNSKRKKSIGGDDVAEEEREQSSWPKKPTLIKPIPLRVQPKLSFGSGSSPFQPWKRPFGGINNGVVGNAGEITRTNEIKPRHRLATCSNSNDMDIENSIEKNTINYEIIIGTNSGDGGGNDDDIIDDDQVQEEQPNTVGNAKAEMDPKMLKRIMSNRLSAQRSRDKRNAYIAELEDKAKGYQEKIALINPKIEAQKTIVQSLQIEQHKLKLLMAAREKQRVLQEVAIEKSRAEAERLRKLNMKLAEEAQARMLNMTVALQLTSKSNNNNNNNSNSIISSSLYPVASPLLRGGPFISNMINSHTHAQNGVGTSSIMQVDTTQQTQNQMMPTTWDDNRTRSSIIPNLNIVVKSEPES